MSDTQQSETTDATQSLYAKHKVIHPRSTSGFFTNLRRLAVISLLGLYYVVPWLMWDGRQAVLFDLPERKFYIFGLVFWPQDAIYLTFLLSIAAFALFFFTTLAGRLWCGFACPQTVWTEIFIWMERWVEGDRPQQLKLEKMSMNAYKLRIKLTKHLLWIAFSLWTGYTFVGYFTPIHVLTQEIFILKTSGWETFWVLFYSFATYGNAGWLREQICIYMCPYARFQGAMFDRDTFLVAYDEKRGEPRGARKRNEIKKLGDCVDCGLCVQVCPTGIDIRNGQQYQCITCTACIDACDEVMVKLNRPKGLVGYTTENTLEGKTTHVLRPRILIYSALLLFFMVAMGYLLSQRIPLSLEIVRDRNMLFRETNEGWIENVYTVKILNMDQKDHTYKIEVEGIEGLKLELNKQDLKVPTGKVLDVPLSLQADPAKLTKKSMNISISAQAVDNPSIQTLRDSRFVGPTKN
jgi:cytochrome c oxidase accessory protein FixG